MGIKRIIKKAGAKAADGVAKLSVLSPAQLEDIQLRRETYLSEAPSVNDKAAEKLTERLLAAAGIDIYNEYLNHLQSIYIPIKKDAEYDSAFKPSYNIRFFNITKWVTDKKENSLEKLVNVYDVLSGEACNISLVFHRTMELTEVFLGVTNTSNAGSNEDIENFRRRLAEAIRGNFPGSQWTDKGCKGIIPCLKDNLPYTVASASNIPGEKSEKFVSQTIEKLLDGIIPDTPEKEYTIILLATPINDVEERKLHLAELYSALAPYSGWQTNFTFTQSDSTNSTATFGVNAGVSAGVQNGTNNAVSNTQGATDSESNTETETTGTTTTDSTGVSMSEATGHSDSLSEGESKSHTRGRSINASATANAGIKILGIGTNVSGTVGTGSFSSNADTVSTTKAATESLTETATKTASRAVSENVSNALAKTIGRAVSNSVTQTAGQSRGVNFGGNFGANFARSSNVSATVGKNEGITQTFTNYTIKHTLSLIEEQMKRMDQSTALGMWDFAAYVISEDQNVASNVAHSYLALTQGEHSYMSRSAVNIWRGDLADSDEAKEIFAYLRELRHPIFGLRPALLDADSNYNAYPSFVTATTALSGKELAYSLNFPQKSIAGLPVLECAEFGRNVVSYNDAGSADKFYLGNIFHMNHEERTKVQLSKNSLASHTFITGSTGSGKSNTVYQLLDEADNQNAKFLVIEPAKGEYKSVFGVRDDVDVYGTNPYLTPLLRLNPFSFPAGIHIFEHLDRLVEIFNVCWPMYAAMPAVLKNAIEMSYEDCGWDLLSSRNKYGSDLYPNFADVCRNIRKILDSSEYDSENKGAYKGSLLTRLQSLTNGINGTIFVSNEITPEDLFDKNVIIDLSRVGSSETKSLIMGILVLKLQEHRMSVSTAMNTELKHITVLEEAHNLLKRTSTNISSESSNLIGKSVEMISNAIAEMRTYGEGFIIVDQAPGLLDMAAIRNTNTKIIMRLPDQSDRELVGRAANLDDSQITELARIPCGVAAVYQNEWVQPVLCKVEKFAAQKKSYVYVNDVNDKAEISPDYSVKVASILCNSSSVGREIIMGEIAPRLKQMSLPSSVIAEIIKTLLAPPKTTNAVNLGRIISALFPDVSVAVKSSYERGLSPSEWTDNAIRALEDCVTVNIDNQLRRDIIQATITHYLLTEARNEAALNEWKMKGYPV